MYHSKLALIIFGLSIAGQSPLAETRCTSSAAEVFVSAGPSIVMVFSLAIDPFSLVERVRQEVGSGIVIEGGDVVTNAHVVYEASEIAIALDDGNVFPSTLVGIDEVSDLAIVRPIGASLPLKAATFAPVGSPLDMGTDVLAIGYPFGLEKSISRGIVSGIGRVIPFTPTSWLTPLIQTDAAVNPGNSGGALLNLCGEIVGVNTFAIRHGQNVSFAIPIQQVRQLLPDLLQHGRVIRPWHGVYGQPVPPIVQFTLGFPPGLLVETIEPGSPADLVGLLGGTLPVTIGHQEYLLGGDIIMEVNGSPFYELDKVLETVRGFYVGQNVTLKYWRNGRRHEVVVTLPERPVLAGDSLRFRERRQGHSSYLSQP